ncbi:MAG: alginate export family protein [Pseudomonadota bacterium]
MRTSIVFSGWLCGLGLGLLPATQARGDEAPPPMVGQRDGVWGDLTLQYRARPELRENADLDAAAADTLVFGSQRARLGLGMHYQDWLTGFVQVQDARLAGFGNDAVGYSGNTDLHQAWAEVKIPSLSLALKLGRQQLMFGDQRLVGALEWANQGRVFEAARLTWKHGLGSLDAFSAVFTPGKKGNLLDATHFSGLYSALAFLDGTLVCDQYLLTLVDTGLALPAGTLLDPGASEAQTALRRQIFTLGTRARYAGFGVNAGVEGALQLGSLNADAQVGQFAYALHGDAAYTLALPTSPSLGLEVNVATGDDTGTAKQSERFINLFPTNHGFYGFMDLASWSNALNGALHAKLTLWSGVQVGLSYWLLARATADDGWTNAGGATLLAANNDQPGEHADELLLGHELDATVSFKVNAYLTWQTGLSTFLPTGFALDKGSDAQLWGYSMLTASF